MCVCALRAYGKVFVVTDKGSVVLDIRSVLVCSWPLCAGSGGDGGKETQQRHISSIYLYRLKPAERERVYSPMQSFRFLLSTKYKIREIKFN